MAKVQFNCRLDEDVAKWIAEESERRSVDGKKFSQADVVTMLVGSAVFDPSYSPEMEAKIRANVTPRRQSKKEKAVAELAASDLTAQRVGRNDIEYGSHEVGIVRTSYPN